MLHTCQVLPALVPKPVAPAKLVKRLVDKTTFPAELLMVAPLSMVRGAVLMIWTLPLLLSPVALAPCAVKAPTLKLALLFTVTAPTLPWLTKADKRLAVLLKFTSPGPAITKPPVLPSITPLALKPVPLTRSKLLLAKFMLPVTPLLLPVANRVPPCKLSVLFKVVDCNSSVPAEATLTLAWVPKALAWLMAKVPLLTTVVPP